MVWCFKRPKMASSSFISVQQNHSFFSNTLCKFLSTPTIFNSPCLSRFPSFFPSKHRLRLVRVEERVVGEFSTTCRDRKPSKRPSSSMTQKLSKNGSRRLGSGNDTLVKKSVEDFVNLEVEERNGKRLERDKNARNSSGSANGMKMSAGISILESRSDNGSLKVSGGLRDGEKIKEKSKRNQVVEEREKLSKGSYETPFRLNLDMCSKTGDFMGAIKLYEWAQREGIKLEQYHYAVILYLCSSAALGVIQPAKSGSGNRTLNSLTLSKVGSYENSITQVEQHSSKTSSVKSCGRTELNAKNDRSNSDGMIDNKENTVQFTNGSMVPKAWILDEKSHSNILVDEDFKKYALERGFEIYEKMCAEKVPMNEATLTSVARMAMSMGDGDMAFNMVKQMKPLGLNPRLRSYGPALSAFCNNGEIDKAFSVEKHMLEHGVYPEEPELEALLRVSINASNAEKVYYLLHKLRTGVRQVSPSTADLIVTWFKSKDATKVGKVKLHRKKINKAIENGGGGWHGLGWLGRGKWSVSSTNVGKDGLCKACGEKLATIDLDPIETENFAESVAAIATQREKNSSFQKFQKWLEYYGPFEAVIDAANVGLFSQRRFTPSKVNLIANGIRQKLPSKKWPLIVLHNRRITGRKMDEPVNKTLIEKWKNADALYATPTGSNDDWYWLYAAIKFKCLIVTNDEMRDHTFQLLGNDFFPRWKERHQVHFSFSATGPAFHMPPPCSVVIQESEKGHWHVPLASEHGYEEDRKWLCITRGNSQSHMTMQESLLEIEGTTRRMPRSISSSDLNAEGEAEESTRFQNALLELKGLRSQLHQAADYCESTFLRTKEKNEVVENTKEYLCRAMVTVVDHLGSVTSKLESCISQTNAFNDVELRLNCLNQRLLSCKQYAQNLELSRLRWSEILPRYHPRYVSPVSKDAEKLNRSSSINLCRDSNDLPFVRTIGNCKLDIFTEKPMPVLLYKFYTYNLSPSKNLSHGFTSRKDDKEKTLDTLQKAILPADDGLSVRSKGPNSTFYFQVSHQKRGRHRRSKLGSGIFSFIRTKQIA